MCKHLARQVDSMNKGKMRIAAPKEDGVEDVLNDWEPLLPAQERKRLWDFLQQFPGVTQLQKHVLIRRLVDEAEFGDIGKELKTSAQNAHDLYKRALKRVKKAWEEYERT